MGPKKKKVQTSDLYHIMDAVGQLPPDKQHQKPVRKKGKLADIPNEVNQQDGWWNQMPQDMAEFSNLPSAVLPKKAAAKKKSGRGKAIDFSDSSETGDAAPEVEAKEAPVLIMDQPSAPVFSIMVIIALVLVFICSVFQYGGFMPFSSNPLYGPDETTLVMFGAKYSPLILEGEYWRFITAIFVSSGAIHLLICVFLILITLTVERATGFWRAFFIFLIAGSYGFILSSLFIPEAISVGANGCYFGYIGIMLADLISSWKGLKQRYSRLVLIIMGSIVCIVFGLTPYMDNFANIGGFLMGFLLALMLLPNITFGKCAAVVHAIIAFLSFPVMSILYLLTFIMFFRRVDGATSWCTFCYNLNCVNISGWCEPVHDYSSNRVMYMDTTIPSQYISSIA